MKIVIFPKSDNPYQNLLYQQEPFDKFHFEYLNYYRSGSELVNRVMLFISIVNFRLRGFKFFHLHWFFVFVSQPDSKLVRLLNTVYIPIFLIFIRLLGFKLVWTVHNVVPHEKTSLNDWWLTFFTYKISNAVIVHSRETLSILQSNYGAGAHSYVIPMGHEIVKAQPTQNEARSALGIENERYVLLFFGLIKPYKGITGLISVFNYFKKIAPNAHLYIVGDCQDKLHLVKLKLMAKQNKNITLITRSVSDPVLSYFIAAADCTVFPFKSVTSSSSVLRALIQSRAVIAPKIGALTDLPENVGYFYMKQGLGGLLQAMTSAYNDSQGNESVGLNGHLYMSKFNWQRSAQRTSRVFFDVRS